MSKLNLHIFLANDWPFLCASHFSLCEVEKCKESVAKAEGYIMMLITTRIRRGGRCVQPSLKASTIRSFAEQSVLDRVRLRSALELGALAPMGTPFRLEAQVAWPAVV